MLGGRKREGKKEKNARGRGGGGGGYRAVWANRDSEQEMQETRTRMSSVNKNGCFRGPQYCPQRFDM